MAHPAEAWAGVAEATGPVFSTDGTSIFHLHGQGGLMQAWVMDADGGNPRHRGAPPPISFGRRLRCT